MTRICGTSNHTLQTRERCVGFEVHHQRVFYGITPPEFRKFFLAADRDYVLKKLKDAHGVHTWNSHTWQMKGKMEKKNTALNALGEQHCPRVYKIVKGNWFDDFNVKN